MAKNIEKIAAGLGAKVVGQVPDTGGGAFGAARLGPDRRRHPGPPRAGARTPPGQADRSELGAPSQGADERGNPPRLARLAEQSSTGGRKVSPMQIAAQLLEEALAGIPER